MDALKIDVEDVAKRLGSHSGPEQQGGFSRNTELYFDPDSDDDQPLVILHHIRKTAGTSLRFVVKANFPQGQRVVVPFKSKWPRVRNRRSKLIEAHRDFWNQLTPDERRSLRCVISHEANFFQPVVERKSITVSLIRHPVDRVLSVFYFKDGTRDIARLEDCYREVAGGRASKTFVRKQKYFNGQSRSLLEPFYDTSSLRFTAGPSDDADLWRGRLFSLADDVYTLGISERFGEFVGFLFEKLRWPEAFSPHMKLNRDRPRTDTISADLANTIADYNWLDLELYNRQVARLGSAPGLNCD